MGGYTYEDEQHDGMKECYAILDFGFWILDFGLGNALPGNSSRNSNHASTNQNGITAMIATIAMMVLRLKSML